MVTDIRGWLDRVDIDPSDYNTIRDLQAAVREETRGKVLTMAQMSAISTYFTETQINFVRYGVKTVTYTWYGRETARYILPEQRGLFGYASAVRYTMEQAAA